MPSKVMFYDMERNKWIIPLTLQEARDRELQIDRRLKGLLDDLMQDDPLCNKDSLIREFDAYPELQHRIIEAMYRALKTEDPKRIRQNLDKYRATFNLLAVSGARYEHLCEKEELMFQDLIQNTFEIESINRAYEHALLNHPNGTRTTDLLLACGANINGNFHKQGTVLHLYLFLRKTNIASVIRYFESKRDPSKPNTQFMYDIPEGGETLLLFFIAMQEEEAALLLLELNKQGISVGINQANKQGQTPLLLAASRGMLRVVKELIAQGVSPEVLDNNGLGLKAYAHFSSEELRLQLTRVPYLHPDCGFDSPTSFLRDKAGNYVCFLEDGIVHSQPEEFSKCFLLVSPDEFHIARLLDAVAYLQNINEVWAKELVTLMAQQITILLDSSQKTLLQSILEQQKEVQEWIKEHVLLVEDSAHFTLGKSLFSLKEIKEEESKEEEAMPPSHGSFFHETNHPTASSFLEVPKRNPLISYIIHMKKGENVFDLRGFDLHNLPNKYIDEAIFSMPQSITAIDLSNNQYINNLPGLNHLLRHLQRKEISFSLDLSNNFTKKSGNPRWNIQVILDLHTIYHNVFLLDLRRLNLSFCNLNLCMSFFCDYLKQARSQSFSMNLSANKLNAEHVKLILQSIPPGLTMLNLNNNPIELTEDEVLTLYVMARTLGLARNLKVIYIHGQCLNFDGVLIEDKDWDEYKKEAPISTVEASVPTKTTVPLNTSGTVRFFSPCHYSPIEKKEKAWGLTGGIASL